MDLIKSFNHEDNIKDVLISPNYKYMAVLLENKKDSINFWNFSDETIIKSLEMPGGESKPRSLGPMIFSIDSFYFICASDNDNFAVWTCKEARLVRTLQNFQVNHIKNKNHLDYWPTVYCFDCGEKLMASGHDCYIIGWSYGGRVAWTIEDFFPYEQYSDGAYVCAMNLTSDGKSIITGLSNGAVDIWDCDTGFGFNNPTGKRIKTLRDPFKKFDTRVYRDLKLSSDDSYVYALDSENVLRIWDFNSGELKNIIHKVKNIALYDKNIIGTDINNKINIWDPLTGDVIKTINGYESYKNSFHITAAKKYLIGIKEKTINIFDLVDI